MKSFKKYLLLGIAYIAFANEIAAQKPSLSFSDLGSWPSLDKVVISNDGKFVLFQIDNVPIGGHTLILHDLKKGSDIQIKNSSFYEAKFTGDSKFLIWSIKDSLHIFSLTDLSTQIILKISSYKLSKEKSSTWLGFKQGKNNDELTLVNLNTGFVKSFSDIKSYFFTDNGNALILQRNINTDSLIKERLDWVELETQKVKTIWNGNAVADIFFDANGHRLAFLTRDTVKGNSSKTFWYYHINKVQADKLVDDNSPGIIDQGFQLGDIKGFSKDGKALFFNLSAKSTVEQKKDIAKVHVWSYLDTKLQVSKAIELKDFLAVVNVKNPIVHRLAYENDEIGMLNTSNISSQVILITQRSGRVDGDGESNWNRGTLKRYYLFSLEDGSRKEIEILRNHKGLVSLSPHGKFLLYYDAEKRNYFSYEVANKRITNITRDIKTEWTPKLAEEEVFGESWTKKPALWFDEDRFVLLYDRSDIWKIDLEGTKRPSNLTNGYGALSNCSFELALDYSTKNLKEGDSIVAVFFNHSNKKNGFCYTKLNRSQEPELRGVDNLIYCGENLSNATTKLNSRNISVLVKARDSEVYAVFRQKVDEYPNLFTTTNFKDFNQLTDLQPEKKYNWLTSELHTWTSLDGRKLQGILFKPENFSVNKKYPVIFYYYEKLSDALNLYLFPRLSRGSLNVAWYVSNGYLVFTPDIYYKIGDPGQSTYDAVVSAANYLKKLPFVNGAKMGLQGFSFGGFETNYLVTHSKIFAAACSGAGCSDVISAYGAMSGSHKLELGQYRIGENLWEKKNVYLKNSSVLYANKVVTPVLLMHNTVDGAVPFSQGVEFFTALRRLGKKAWLLEYEDGNHGVDGKSAEDFTVRMSQFFDHYLKDAPAPKWMTRSVTPKMKISGNDLQLDDSIKTPGPGILIEY